MIRQIVSLFIGIMIGLMIGFGIGRGWEPDYMTLRIANLNGEKTVSMREGVDGVQYYHYLDKAGWWNIVGPDSVCKYRYERKEQNEYTWRSSK